MEKITVKGSVEYIRYQNPDTGWTIAVVHPEKAADTATVTFVGVMPGLAAGMTLTAEGAMEASRWGEQLRVSSWEESLPSDLVGIERYLGSGLIKDIGPVLAAEIVRTFGEESLDVLDNHPERLTEVRGIGRKRARSITEAVAGQKAVRAVMIWMKRYGLPNGLAVKLHRQYGDAAIVTVQENPYRLADDFEGIGFRKADQVALSIGFDPADPLRVRSGILHVLREAVEEGSTCLPRPLLLRRAASDKVLGLPEETVSAGLVGMAGEGGGAMVYEEDGYVYLGSYYRFERRVAARLRDLAEHNADSEEEVDVDAIARATGVDYEPEQAEAVRTAVRRDLMVLTGGPGTGKTVTTKAIITALEGKGLRVLLAAPTGRAAKRMAEVTGRPARTIHRLLEYQGHFTRCRENPLEGDALVVDESSMIDTFLMHSLLDAVPSGMKVVFVGDVDQLPSVGAGTVLRDMIDSGVLPTVRLCRIFRQAQDSDIVMNAHAVNRGEMPRADNHPGTDFWFVERASVEDVSRTVEYLVGTHIPERLGFAASEVQVLTPMRKESDPIGATRLNRVLQRSLNGKAHGLTFGDTEYRLGDRVMQTKNDYEKGVFNGDMGTVSAVDAEEGTLTVEFEGVGHVGYEKKELANLDLAYATTVHKSQGSEYPVVVMPMHRSQYVMLNRNLLYTAITRARRWCILVGTRDALRLAVATEDASRRYTLLRARLAGERPCGEAGK